MKVNYISPRFYEVIMPYGEILVEKKRDTVTFDLCARINYLEEKLKNVESDLEKANKELKMCKCEGERSVIGGMGGKTWMKK